MMKPELLAPAGGYDAALAAFQYGADAVYVGLPRFSARADADNLTVDQLRLLLAYARSFTPAKKIYITFNTLVPEADLPAALEVLADLEALAPDGVIVQDLGVARLARDYFPSLELHASTQMAAHNLDGVLALKELGFKRVVLARELTCAEVKAIVEACGVEIEVFVHGALCYSYSGLCLFSAMMYERSGNRGRCAYCCRQGFSCEGEKGTRYPFSMKDLALAPMLDRLVATGVHALKIEGRMKRPLYVACLSDYYRKKCDGQLTPQAEQQMIQDVQTIFSRPWTTLYATDRNVVSDAIIDPVAIGHRGACIGEAEAVLTGPDKVRWLRFKTARALEKHDGIQVELPGGGKPFGFPVNQMRVVGRQQTVVTVPADSTIEIALPADAPFIPRGTPVYCSASQALRRAYEICSVRESELVIGMPVDFDIRLHPEGIRVVAIFSHFMKCENAEGREKAEIVLPLALEKAQQPERTEGAVRRAFGRLGTSAWSLGELRLSDPDRLYAPPSKLNEARRMVLAALDERHDRLRKTRLACLSREVEQLVSVKRSDHADGTACPRQAGQTLKVRCSDTPLFSPDQVQRIGESLDTLVVLLEHAAYGKLKQQVEAWRSACEGLRVRLALPLISREEERQTLREAVAQFIADGWKEWECADLAGWRLLKESGIRFITADWTFYAFNRMAAAELGRMGITSFVVSPECDMENLCALAESPIQPELLTYQHVPLFISETPLCTGGLPADGEAATFTDRRGNVFLTRCCDGRWITTADAPLDRRLKAADLPFLRHRIDRSWSPEGGRSRLGNLQQLMKNGEIQDFSLTL